MLIVRNFVLASFLALSAQARTCLEHSPSAMRPTYQCGPDYVFCTDFWHGDDLNLSVISSLENIPLHKLTDTATQAEFSGDGFELKYEPQSGFILYPRGSQESVACKPIY